MCIENILVLLETILQIGALRYLQGFGGVQVAALHWLHAAKRGQRYVSLVIVFAPLVLEGCVKVGLIA